MALPEQVSLISRNGRSDGSVPKGLPLCAKLRALRTTIKTVLHRPGRMETPRYSKYHLCRRRPTPHVGLLSRRYRICKT